jgi:hypothetical protein
MVIIRIDGDGELRTQVLADSEREEREAEALLAKIEPGLMFLRSL